MAEHIPNVIHKCLEEWEGLLPGAIQAHDGQYFSYRITPLRSMYIQEPMSDAIMLLRNIHKLLEHH